MCSINSNVVWGGGVGSNGGPSPTISLLYPSISLHVTQREPSPALYMVLNYELRFTPQNEGDLQAMYSAMSQGQSLHPDPADEVDDEDPYLDGEEFDEEFEDAEEVEASPAEQMSQLRLDASNEAQYQDCEDAEIEGE